MLEDIKNANLPTTATGRMYHVNVRPGEVANRILTLGDVTRGRQIALLLDAEPKPVEISSHRSFTTITGRYKGVPVTISAVTMGMPNMDFMIRENRAVVSGDMVIVRLGSCGGLQEENPVGSIFIPESSVCVRREYDYFLAPGLPEGPNCKPYSITRPVQADPELHELLIKSLTAAKPADAPGPLLGKGYRNATSDYFYDSQARTDPSFPADSNENLMKELRDHGVHSLEMETYHLYHMAAVSQSTFLQTARAKKPGVGIIRAAAVQMLFGNRVNENFLSPAVLPALQEWTGKAALDALVSITIAAENLHPESGSVWCARSP